MAAGSATLQDGASGSTASLSDVLDELPDGVLVLSIGGDIERANRAFLETTGWRAADVTGRALHTIVADEDMLHLVGFDAMLSADTVHDGHMIFVGPEGARRPLIVASTLSRDGKRVFLTTRTSGAVHRELADTTRWAASEQSRADEIERARDALQAKNAALHAAQAEIERAYAQLRGEVETRERLENELRLAQKLESIGHLAAGVAHEINTPMQYIGDNLEFLRTAFQRFLGYIDAVKGQSTEDEALKKRLEAAHKKARLDFLIAQVPEALTASRQGVDHVSNIVRAMKSFAHPDSNQKSPGDVNQAIRDTLMVAQNEYKNVAVAETELGELPPVNCFVGRLNQVFLNLIVNAAHAIADAKRDSPGKIRVTSRAVDGVVEVTIGDNGCGMPEEIRAKVFDQFFTTKEVGRGTGQGLSLARSIVVEAHGGTLSFETAVGVGTTFLVRLPIDGTTRLSGPDTVPSSRVLRATP
jgi:PAS domain S-box-containing protein